MAIFYWNNHGRLGNLLFQYAAILRHTSPRDRIITFCNEVFDLIEIDPRLRMIPGEGITVRRIQHQINKLAVWLVRTGAVGILEPRMRMLLDRFPVETLEVRREPGQLPRCAVFQGYFQDGSLQNVPIALNRERLSSAKLQLEKLAGKGVIVAVHLRLTDYSSWPVLGVPGALLPIEWYGERINDMRSRLHAPVFVIFSDDMESVKRLLPAADLLHFSGGAAAEDFTAMALCDHAIISPSSFAWWAAVIHRRPDKIVMAPTYWAGFKSSIWYPPTIFTPGIEYHPVP